MNTKPRRGAALLKGLVCLFSALPLSEVMAAQLDALKVNGFLTAALQQSDEKDTVYNPGYAVLTDAQIGTGGVRGDHATVAPGSVAGLQFDYKLNPKANLTAQYVARGSEGWNLGAEWAYMTYSFRPDVILKAGRMRTAFFMFSESQEVGFSYPWVKLPTEHYNTLLTAADGLELKKKFAFGDWGGDVRTALTSASRKKGAGGLPTDLIVKRGFSLAGSLYYDSFSFFACALNGVVQSDLSSAPEYLTLDAGLKIAADLFKTFDYEDVSVKRDIGARYYDMGMTFDNGTWWGAVEAGKQVYKISVQPDFRSAYAAIGRRFGDWMPYYTIARVDTLERGDKLRAAVMDIDLVASQLRANGVDLSNLTYQQTAHYLGVRYDVSSRSDVKFQWTRTQNMGGTRGLFAPVAPTDHRANIFAMSFDAVF